MPDFFEHRPPIKSAWNETRMLIRGPLTNKKIEAYQKRGWYSAEFREARKDMMARKASKRRGNFDEIDGRMIYRP